MNRIFILAGIIVVIVIIAVILNAQNGYFSNAERWVKSGESESRISMLKPDLVVEKIGIKKNDIIADIGAGSGIFTRRFASAAPGGRAFGFDVEQSMVDYMKKDAEKLSLKNYYSALIDPAKPDFKDEKFDIIFLCNTYHHISGRSSYFSRLKQWMNSNSRIVILDFKKMAAPSGPPIWHKIDKNEVIADLDKAGYRLIKDEDFIDYHYYLEFKQK